MVQVNKSRILLLMNTSENSYHNKERIPSIISDFADEVFIIDIFGFESDEAAQKINQLSDKELIDFFTDADNEKLCIDLVNRINTYKPTHVVFFTAGELMLYYTPSLTELLRASRIVVGCVLGDDEFLYNKNKYYLPLFDFVVAYTHKEYLLYKKYKQNTILLPIGVHIDESCEVELGSDTNRVDVVFIGRPYGSRREILEYLIDNGIRVKIHGSREWMKYPKLRTSYAGFVSNDNYCKALSEGEIVLSLMEYIDGEPHINSKVFDAVRVGRMAVSTYYKPFTDVYGLVEGESIVMYKDKRDLLEKTKKYLRECENRKRIALNMQAVITGNFTYRHLHDVFFKQVQEMELRKHENNNSDMITFVIIEDFELFKQTQELFKTDQVVHIVSKRSVSSSEYEVTLNELQEKKQNILSKYVVVRNRGYSYTEDFMMVLNHAVVYNEELYTFNSVSHGKVLRKSRYVTDVNSLLIRKDIFTQNPHKFIDKKLFFSIKGKITAVDVPINNYESHVLPTLLTGAIKGLKVIKRSMSFVAKKSPRIYRAT